MTDNITKRLSKIRETLDGVYDRLKDVFLTTSVLKVVREYAWRSIDDIELWALFCATLDFQVPVISWLIPMLSGLLRELEHKRIKFIDIVYNHDLAKNLLTNFKWYGAKKTGFSHRFIKLDDILKFFKALKQIHSREGSIGNLVCRLYNHALNRDSKEPIVDAIKGLARCLRNELKKAYGDTTNARTKISRFIPDPDGKSAMKRLCLYFRWMTRGYPDLGLWDFIDPQHLLVSLDVGVIRVVNRAFKGIMKQLGISIKENATLDMAIRVTCFLRHVNSEDPAKYDYVLSRPSIMGYCVKQSGKSKCYLCPIYEICESSRKLPPPRKGRHPLSEREKRIFERFKLVYGSQFDKFNTSYPVGDRTIDVVAHERRCRYWVIEIEPTLNYEAIGQAVAYRLLYQKHYGIRPKAAIICAQAKPDLKHACEYDADITVFVV